MMTVLEILRKKLVARQVDAGVRFLELVHQVADGQEPDADTAAEILRVVGKTVDDLAAAVACLQERRRLRALLDKGPELERELSDIAARIEKAHATLTAAERKHRETVEPLAGRKIGLEAELNRLPELRQRLIATCQDPELVAEHGRLAAALREAHNQRSAAMLTQREATSQARGWRAEAARGGDDAERQAAKAARFEQQAAEAARALREAEAEIARLEKESTALEAKMLEP